MDISLAQANGITESGGIDPKFFKRIEEDLLRVAEMYKMSEPDRENIQRSFRDARESAQELKHVDVLPFDVAETVRVTVDPNTGFKSPSPIPENVIRYQEDLRIVEGLMRQITLHGTTGDTKQDDTVKYLYGKLLELTQVHQQEELLRMQRNHFLLTDLEESPWRKKLFKDEPGYDPRQNPHNQQQPREQGNSFSYDPRETHRKAA